MKFNIISNLNNGVGLERDYKIVRSLIEARGHVVAPVQFNQLPKPVISKADVNLWLEVIVPKLVQFGTQNWLVPNPEWFFQGWLPVVSSFQRILCKTSVAVELFKKWMGSERVTFVGFESADLYDPYIKREKIFLHVVGKSGMKNTRAVCEAWERETMPAPLIVVAERYHCRAKNAHNFRRLDDEQFRQLMNRAAFHLLPSEYEGWGHGLHEAEGVGAAIITSDWLPMSEITHLSLVKPRQFRMHHCGKLGICSWPAVATAVRNAMNTPDEKLAELSEIGRRVFAARNRFFRETFTQVIMEAE